MRHSPARQTARILIRRAREARATDHLGSAETPAVRTAWVPPELRPPSYSYRGFRGPWLEEHFFRTWVDAAEPNGAVYLPVFFDSLFFHAQCHAFLPSEFRDRYTKLWAVLSAAAASSRPYFTVLGMYEFPIWEWHLFPRNIVVASADGYGDLAIPLLKGDRPLVRRKKDVRISFIGALEGPSDTLQVRSAMKAVFKEVAQFGEGADWEEMMARSAFSLCPRGQGPTSFRLYEALSVTSIPIYIWKAQMWLPYADELDWESVAVVVEAADMASARDHVLGLSDDGVQAMHDRIAKTYDAYFRYDAVCVRLRRRMATISDRHEAEQLAAGREQFAFR